MKFRELSEYLLKLEKASSRIEITELLAEVFKKSSQAEIRQETYLILGTLAPKYKNIVFNIAERMMVLTISKAYKKNPSEVRSLYKKKGDLGDVCFELNKSLSKKNPTISEVYQDLLKIAELEGEGSQEEKIRGMAVILAKLDPLSSKFVARIPLGRLRLGFSDKTILDALSWMERGDKSAKKELDFAYQVLPDPGLLAQAVKAHGIKKGTTAVKPVVGIPVLPMLAQRLKSPKEMIEKMGEVAIEPKFDGLRIQIHFKKGKKGFVKAFTRNLNEISWMFPELNDIIKYLSAEELILDSEAVGVDEKRKALANFQQTMTRRRKHDIKSFASKVPIRFYVFDILFKDGMSLMMKTYKERRGVLAKTVKSGNLLIVDEYKLTSSPKEIEEKVDGYLRKGLEGIIVKKAESQYIPGRTGWRWVKMKEKETSSTKLADTIDTVIMGYSSGRGKRANLGVGQFLAGIKDNDKIKSITKVGTGLTDEQFRELNKRLAKLRVYKKPREYVLENKNLEPDFWVLPDLVVELAADEITVSPSHSSGYALRFPRLVRFRDDKNLGEITTLSEVKKLYKIQNK